MVVSAQPYTPADFPLQPPNTRLGGLQTRFGGVERDQSLFPVGIQTRHYPAHSLVTTPTTVQWLMSLSSS